MKTAVMSTTVSTKGQVILPKALRDRHRWSTGTRLEIVDTVDGVVLKSARLFPETIVDEVAGSAGYKGPALTLEQMDAAVAAEARRRARD